ncbi:M48 family metallopeptidase [Alkalibaculum bacchi]|uniref:M48 family metallopeptidase n=1 Tax=Alkalibaculum bacchi TaxID=645887 RepID=UPI000DEB5CB1|nr:M48 family metallopeptidase [Alkalibaculum bacchi]
MNKKLQRAMVLFFALLILFIMVVYFAEINNMNDLRVEYPQLQEEAYSFRKDNLKVWGVRLLLTFIIPLLFLTSGFSQRISTLAGNRKGVFQSGILYGMIFFSLIFLISLPLDFYSSYILPHKYGLSDQSFFRWLEINIKEFLINDLIISLFLWIPYLIIYKHPKTWWFKIALIIIPIIIFITFISPLVIDPIFNEYTSIEDEKLGQEIEGLLSKAGIEDAGIYKVDKSKDTKTMNAYMTGIFDSKRIVLWDTTINNLEEDEVLSITAHEIGHYEKGHIGKSIIISSISIFLIIYLVYRLSTCILKLSNGAFGFKDLCTYASIPLLIIMLNLFSFLSNPISSYLSRSMEIEADRYEISLTEDRESAVSAMEKLTKTSLGLPRPSNIYKIWYHTHPTLEDRIELYRSVEYEKIEN